MNSEREAVGKTKLKIASPHRAYSERRSVGKLSQRPEKASTAKARCCLKQKSREKKATTIMDVGGAGQSGCRCPCVASAILGDRKHQRENGQR